MINPKHKNYLLLTIAGVLILGGVFGYYLKIKKSAPTGNDQIVPNSQPVQTQPPQIPIETKTNIQGKKEADIPGWKIYQDKKYGFTFTYPPDYIIDGTYGSGNDFGNNYTIDFDEPSLLEIRIQKDWDAKWGDVNYGTSENDFLKTAVQKTIASALCMADGHGSGSALDSLKKQTNFVTKNGLRGYELYFSGETWSMGEPDKFTTAGPVYVLDITEQSARRARAMFFINYGLCYDRTLSSEELNKVKNIIESISFQ